jgi:hypothetical protein
MDVLAVLAWTGNKIMPAPMHLRVFISSPSDVADERNLARRLLKDELPYDVFLRDKVTLQPVSWDDPAAPTPMVATLTPQEAVNRFGCQPSECDIVIVVLWSRLGTHLDLSKFSKPNGEPYLSGTEYEYEQAASAKKPPDITLCTGEPKECRSTPMIRSLTTNALSTQGLRRFSIASRIVTVPFAAASPSMQHRPTL